MTTTLAPTHEIGYAQAPNYNWWTYQDETTPELLWPQSISVYDTMRRTDSQVTSVLRAMTLPVRRTPWRIDPNGARDEVVRLVADDLGLPIVGKNPIAPPRNKDRFSWAEHLRLALLMLPFGHMYFEQTYRVVGGVAHLRKLGPRMPKTIERIDVAEDGGLISITQFWTTKHSPPRPIPVNRLVAYVHEREGGNWLGQSILRPAYKNWLLKDRLLRVQAQTIERNGMGIPLYKDAEGATPEQHAAGLAMAKAWRAGEAAGSAIPFGAELLLVGVSGELPDAEPAIRYHDEQIGRAVLAHFLNLGTQTGSWALGTTFADFFTMSLQTLAEQIADTATQHIVEDLVDVNFGTDEPAPKIVFDEIGSRQAATAAAIKSLVDAGILEPDAVLEESTRQQYGLPPKDPDSTRGQEQQDQFALSPVFASAGADDDEDVVEALLTAITLVSGQILAAEWNPLLHPRGEHGRFRTVLERVMNALGHWAKGDGPEDPLPESLFTREHLRKTAIARGLTVRRGATREELHDQLLQHVREVVHTRREAKLDAGPRQAKFTLQQPGKLHDKDVAVYRLPGDKPGLFFEDEHGNRGGLVERFDSLDDLHAWASERGETRLAQWADKERGGTAPGKALSSGADIELAKDLATPRKATGRKTAPVTGSEAMDATAVEPTGVQREALGRYGGDGGYVVNNDLRAVDGRAEDLQPRNRATVEALDALMADSPLSRDVVVHRKLSLARNPFSTSTTGEVDPLDRDLTGFSWIEPAYASTSVDEEKLKSREISLRITVPAGTPAISNNDLLDNNEVLLPRGHTFRVTADHGKDDRFVRHLDVEIVPAPASAPKPTPDAPDVDSLRQLGDPEAIRDALDLRKVDELKAMLREQKLPVSGRKRELVDRLVEHLGPAQGRGEAQTNRPGGHESVLSAAEQDRVRRLVNRDPQIFATTHERFGRVSTSGNLSEADADWLQGAYDRDRVFVERVAQEMQIKHYQDREAKKAGMTPAEYRRTASARLKELLDGKPIAVRVRDEDGLRDILSGGRFKTSLEGAKRAPHLGTDKAHRRLAEAIQGTPDDVPAAERPIYGYVAVNGVEPALAPGKKIPGIAQREGQEDILSSYGQIQVVLKPGVRSRTTATVGDSLDEVGFLRPSPVDNPTAESLGVRDLESISEPGWTRRGYVEAQIHGGVKAGDIEQVVFADAPDASTTAALKKAGIPYRVLRPGDAAIVGPTGFDAPDVEQAARDRQVKLDRVRSVAESLAEVDELASSQATPRALQSRIRSRAKANGLPDSTRDELLAVAKGDGVGARASHLRTTEPPPGMSSTPIVPTPTPPNPKSPWGKFRDRPTVKWSSTHGRPGALDQVDRVYTAPTREDARGFLDFMTNGRLQDVADQIDDIIDLRGLRVEDDRETVIDRLVDGIREPEVSDLNAELDRIATSHGLTRITGPAGTVEPFDPERHEWLGERPEPGTPVTILRPGYDADVDGENVRALKAMVQAAPEPDGSAVRATGRDISSGVARGLAEQFGSAESVAALPDWVQEVDEDDDVERAAGHDGTPGHDERSRPKRR